MPQFILKIDLGNDAMKSTSDLGEKLRDMADLIESYGEPEVPGMNGKVIDNNGNVVGHYEVVDTP